MQAETDCRIKFLRGIEVTSQLGGSQTVHFTCIFPENIPNEDIENEFLVWLGIPSNKKLTDAEHQAKSLPHQDIIRYARRLGCLIGVHAKGKSNSIENIDNSTPAKMLLKAKILGYIHFLETGKIVDSSIYHNVIFKEIGFERPIVVCSDYHAEYNYGQYKNNGTGQIMARDTTWIKSELSFSGLRQMYFEPDLRVGVQTANPYEDKHGIQLESLLC